MPEMVVLRSDFESRKSGTIKRTVSFKRTSLTRSVESDDGLDKSIAEEPMRSVRRKVGNNLMIETAVSFKNLVPDGRDSDVAKELEDWLSPKPPSQVNAAATRLQKVYRSYRTRRNLADCAVVVEELWWKALDFAALKRSSVSFFDSQRPETASSRWARARTRAAKVGKGLSKHGKAQKLALRHWLEAIDPRHRYGHNLQFYYAKWFSSGSYEPFFYWLDIGKGKELSLEKCPRTTLQHQCIKYLGPMEREAYEVIVENGKLLYKQNGVLLDTAEGTKWIFVLSTLRKLYVAEKKKGGFQHSSFLAGGATIAAGRLVARNGVLVGTWGYSGHYRPTEENFKDFISFLEEHQVDLTNVKKCAMDDDIPPSSKTKLKNSDSQTASHTSEVGIDQNGHLEAEDDPKHRETEVELPKHQLGKCLSGKWTSGAGPRISCVREYPTQLQFQALEQVNQSPFRPNNPIPSLRPSPQVLLSPRLSGYGL